MPEILKSALNIIYLKYYISIENNIFTDCSIKAKLIHFDELNENQHISNNRPHQLQQVH